jgi:predicted LPLAT superfamily acyltransferase
VSTNYDEFLARFRAHTLRRRWWPIAVPFLMAMTDEDLDRLEATEGNDEHWDVELSIIERIAAELEDGAGGVDSEQGGNV